MKKILRLSFAATLLILLFSFSQHSFAANTAVQPKASFMVNYTDQVAVKVKPYDSLTFSWSSSYADNFKISWIGIPAVTGTLCSRPFFLGTIGNSANGTYYEKAYFLNTQANCRYKFTYTASNDYGMSASDSVYVTVGNKVSGSMGATANLTVDGFRAVFGVDAEDPITIEWSSTNGAKFESYVAVDSYSPHPNSCAQYISNFKNGVWVANSANGSIKMTFPSSQVGCIFRFTYEVHDKNGFTSYQSIPLTIHSPSTTNISLVPQITSISLSADRLAMIIQGSGFTPTGNTLQIGKERIDGVPSDDGTTIEHYLYGINGIGNLFAGTYPVVVSNTNGTSNSINFFNSGLKVIQPTISSLSPTAVLIGNQITIKGSGFLKTDDSNDILLDYGDIYLGGQFTASSSDGTTLSFVVPSNEDRYNFLTGLYEAVPLTKGSIHTLTIFTENGLSSTIPFVISENSLTKSIPSLTANGQSGTAKITVGDKVNFAWSAKNLDLSSYQYSSNLTSLIPLSSKTTCPSDNTWIANSIKGVASIVIPSTWSNCIITAKYQVYDPLSKLSTSTTLILSVKTKIPVVYPTASITANKQSSSLTVNAGDIVTFTWNSKNINGDEIYSSAITSVGTKACGANTSWIAHTISGTYSQKIPLEQENCVFEVKYNIFSPTTNISTSSSLLLKIKPIPTTASLTVNGFSSSITKNVGDSLNFKWSSTNADKFSSTIAGTSSITGASCGSGAWIANTAQGTSKQIIPSVQAGCIFQITYVASKDAVSATSTLKLTIASSTLTTGSSCGVILPGTTHFNYSFGIGDSIYSCNKQYELLFENSGNVVLYKTSLPITADNALWSSKTGKNGGGGTHSNLYLNGDFEIYNTADNSIWSSLDHGGRIGNAKYLTVQNDGNVVIYDANNKALWVSNTAQPTPSAKTNSANLWDALKNFFERL